MKEWKCMVIANQQKILINECYICAGHLIGIKNISNIKLNLRYDEQQ